MQKPVFKANIKHLFLQQFCFSSHTTLPLFKGTTVAGFILHTSYPGRLRQPADCPGLEYLSPSGSIVPFIQQTISRNRV
ncbi:MAG: hypothetical protein K9H26_17530, partial [Prolixibacteraceae bacterium]|nr:hypothetical protein [Prolixibacteraceae bacterium]